MLKGGVADTADEVSEAAAISEVAIEVSEAAVLEVAIEVAISEEDIFMAAVTGDIHGAGDSAGDSASGDGPIGDGLITGGHI